MPLDLKKPVPLYLQIAEDIRAKIDARTLRMGDQLGSQQELSREYRVSLMTVKKALAHLAHHGLVYGRMGKGSFVGRRSAVSPQSMQRSIGIVLENLQSPFFSLIVQAAEEAAYQRGYNVLLSNSFGRSEKEEEQIRHFWRIGAGGLLIASLHHIYHATPTIHMLHRERFPLVMVSYMDDPDIPFVGTDHEEGAYMATHHLLRLGYKRIGYINAERGNLVGELRKTGYVRALSDAGRSVEQRFLYRIRVQGTRNYYASGYELGQRFCRKRGIRPDAVFAYNDMTALGFQRAVLEHGLRVPDDIAMVGFDNIEPGKYAGVPLTTIEQQTARIGSDAVDILTGLIEGRKTLTRKIFAPRLVVRESCGSPSVKSHMRSRALKAQTA